MAREQILPSGCLHGLLSNLQHTTLMGVQSTIYPPRLSDGPSWIVCLFVRHCGLSKHAFLLVMAWVSLMPVAGAQVTALTTSLRTPTSIAYDTNGNLYIAEMSGHVVRRVDTAGVLTTVAGDGTQGFSGDSGPAISAQLDSPSSVALDAAANLYIADSHNQRIRRVNATTGVITTFAGNGNAAFSGDGGAATLASLDLPSALSIDTVGNLYIADGNNHRIREVMAATGVIATVAGNGLQGFSGDGGDAKAASIDSPGGLAVDAAGNIYIADTHNHRVRVVSATTGLITTVAGTGTPGYTGDNGAGTGAGLALPRGVSVDASGNMYVADSNNQRIRRISPQGIMTTVAGDGIQMFAGDGGAAIAASLDTPRATTLSSLGLVTLADTSNERVRQVAADATIATIAGIGSTSPGALAITGPSESSYGTGTLTAALSTSGAATGRIAFFDSTSTGTNALGSMMLAGNSASLSIARLSAGRHFIFATYTGDLTHSSAQSATVSLTISPAPLTASVDSFSILYGQSVPALTGVLSGVLSQDAGNVVLVLSTTATTLSAVGTYPVTHSLSGSAAGNYVLAPVSGAALTIGKATSTTVLSVTPKSVAEGLSLRVTLHVASTTGGTPTGNVTLLDGGMPLAALPLSATGDASWTSDTLVSGSHSLNGVYAGDANFTGSTGVAQSIVVTPVVSEDFTLTATGATSQTVSSGNAATFSFSVQTLGSLSSPITLASSALPVGMTTSFSPAYLPPGGSVTAFTLTVQTSKAVAKEYDPSSQRRFIELAIFGFVLLPFGWRRRSSLIGICSLALLVFVGGCGDRIVSSANSTAIVSNYPITVSGTATSRTGTVLLHTATVQLHVQ